MTNDTWLGPSGLARSAPAQHAQCLCSRWARLCEPSGGYTTRSRRNKNRLHAGDSSLSSATNTARVTAVAPRPERHPGIQASRLPGGRGGREEEARREGLNSLSNSRPGRPSGLGHGDNGNGSDSARGKKDKQRQRASKRGPWLLVVVVVITGSIGRDGDGVGTKVWTASVPSLERFNPTHVEGRIASSFWGRFCHSFIMMTARNLGSGQPGGGHGHVARPLM